jgi:hypothetical protein
MSAFTPLKRNCPICDGERRDCRQNKENSIIHCRANLSIVPSGWKALGQDKWGFEMYIEASQQQDPEAWQQRQREQQAQRQREKEELRRGALPEGERDQAIRRIHRYFGLSSEHRQNLRDRGLLDAHIDRLPYFSFHSEQEVPQFTPANLPGVGRGRLAVKESGFACPIPNIDGTIIGWQNRFDDATNGKYRWPSGQKSAHLPNGELPIGVYRPDGGVTRRAIGHTEGFLKADITAQQWGLPTLGAASANFAASPEQWKASLDQLSAELWIRTIYWFVDAGAVVNPNVTSQYIKSWEKLSEWDYSVQVVWWGQVEKATGDADEISQQVRDSAQLISIDEYLAIAREYGGIKEQPSSYTPSTQGLDRTLTRDDWELKHGFGKRLRERIKRSLEGFRGFGAPPAPKPVVAKEAPDNLFDDANQRLSTWQDAVNQGYQYILDISAPGLGKSHAAGIALPEAFGAEKLWYLSNDHRNPTTGVIEANYVDLPVRNGGLKFDDNRKTPNGNAFLVWPKPGEEPDTKGNCPKADLFQKFRAKNLKAEAAETSPICQACKLAYLCKKGAGQKYGASFRGDRKNALESPRIRAHADSMPSPMDFDYSASGIIWDEVGTQFKAMESVAVTLADFDQVWGELEVKAPHLHEQLKPLRLALRPLLTGEVEQPFHGWDDAGVRALLPEKPSNLDAIIPELEEVLQPDLSFLEESSDSVGGDAGVSKAAQQVINRQFRRQAHEEFSEAFQRVALNWLVPFLRVWNGERGALRCEWQQLTIFTKSDRHTAVAQGAKFNIYLDATITRERLALFLGIDPSEIYVVAQKTPDHNNLRVIHITGMGKLGKNRSESLQKRVALMKAKLKSHYPGVVIGDWQKFTEPGDGQWFVNLRGSNEFQHAPALAVFGNPCQNIGHLQALYQTLTGEYAPLNKETPHEGLQRFIAAHIEAEIEQTPGRLRSHLRPDEQLTFIFIGDYDLSFLGVPIEQVEAFQICPEAGTDAQITRWKILEAIKQLHAQGQKLTQEAIATLIGKSQELISKVAKHFGGWVKLRKLLLVLLDPLYSGSNNFETLTEQEQEFIDGYLSPVIDTTVEAVVAAETSEDIETEMEVLGTTLKQCAEQLGWKKFLQAIASIPASSQANLLSIVLQATGVDLLEEATT